jgi:hypothetical protein
MPERILDGEDGVAVGVEEDAGVSLLFTPK